VDRRASSQHVDELGRGYREPVIEFVADPRLVDNDEDDDVDRADAPNVRLPDMRPEAEVGTHFLSLGQLARCRRRACEVERHGESAEVLEEDKEGVSLRTNVLPPVQRRVVWCYSLRGRMPSSANPPTYATPAATSPANYSRTTRPRASSSPRL
jgi:hypothetical protein